MTPLSPSSPGDGSTAAEVYRGTGGDGSAREGGGSAGAAGEGHGGAAWGTVPAQHRHAPPGHAGEHRAAAAVVQQPAEGGGGAAAAAAGLAGDGERRHQPQRAAQQGRSWIRNKGRLFYNTALLSLRKEICYWLFIHIKYYIIKYCSKTNDTSMKYGAKTSTTHTHTHTHTHTQKPK